MSSKEAIKELADDYFNKHIRHYDIYTLHERYVREDVKNTVGDLLTVFNQRKPRVPIIPASAEKWSPDSVLEEDVLIAFIQYVAEAPQSRYICEEAWLGYLEEYPEEDRKELLEVYGQDVFMITNIPEGYFDFENVYSGICRTVLKKKKEETSC